MKFADFLSLGQVFYIYFRFEHMDRRFYKAYVGKIGNDYIEVACNGADYLIRLDAGSALRCVTDMRGDPYIEGFPVNLSADEIGYSSRSLQGSRIYLYPETDIREKYNSYSG